LIRLRPFPWLTFGAALLTGTVLVVRNVTRNIAADEAYALETSGGSLARAVDRALHFEMQPAGYFVTLNLWRRIDGSLPFARMLSVAFTFAALIPLDRIAARSVSPRTRDKLRAFYLVHPVTLFIGSEAKAYAMTVFLTATLIDLADRAGDRNVALRFLFVALLAINTQYYTAFAIAALVLRAAAEGRWTVARNLTLAALPAAISIVPTLRALPHQLGTAEVQKQGPLAALGLIVARIASFVIPVRAEQHDLRIALDMLAGVVLGATALRTEKRRSAIRARRTLPLAGLVALFHAAGRAAVGAPMNFPHQMTVLYTAMIGVVGEVANDVDSDATLLERLAPYGVLAALAARTALSMSHPGAKKGDWKRVAQAITANEVPGEPIFVFNCEEAVAFAYHYEGLNTLVPLPRPMREDAWDPAYLVIESEDDVERAMQSAGSFETCWLAVSPTFDYLGLQLRPDLIESYIADRFEVISEQPFFFSSLRRLRRR
jgi:hypothetical protein